jgi:hypothetical protein
MRPSFDEFRPAPRFAVNEDVIVVSEGFGVFEARVIAAQWFEQPQLVSGEIKEGMWGYVTLPDHPPVGKHWPEYMLRKKHPPSTESFSEIMQGLKRLIGVEV